MRKEDKAKIIEAVAEQLKQVPHFYVTDTLGLNAENTTKLRRECFNKNVKMIVVKNTLLKKALEKNNFAETDLYSALEGPTTIMLTETANAPAKLIKEFGDKYGKPVLKAAYVQEGLYIGADKLTDLVNIKSREELIGDILSILKAPLSNIMSGITAKAEKEAAVSAE